jgi:uncharacterized protein with PIN domain
MKFLLTRELGRLARWLRILGFDAAYVREGNNSSLIIQALREERVILTRNHRLPCPRGFKIILLEAERIKEQMGELMRLAQIKPEPELMFTRCLLCNERLIEVAKEEVKELVPEYVFKTQDNFVTCPLCKRIYWQGTHWGNVQKTLSEIGEDGIHC